MLRSSAKKILNVLVGFTFLWFGGLILFFQQIPQRFVDLNTHVEAIVVLTGGRERLKTGFQLLCTGRGDLIFISGVHPDESLKTVLKTHEVSEIVCTQTPEWLASRTYIGQTATNTMENAVETAKWLKANHITSIRLVTAAYHMPRSLLEFSHLSPTIKIIPHPVFPSQVNGFNWWRDARTFYLTLSEYHKFLYTFVRMRLLRA